MSVGIKNRLSYSQIAILQSILLLGIYLVKDVLKFRIELPGIALDITGPIMWGSFLVSYYLKIPKKHSGEKLNIRKEAYVWAFNIAAIMITVQMGVGLLVGFGKNPASQSAEGILYNTLTVGCAMVGREVIRTYSARSLKKSNMKLGLIGITILFSLTEISVAKLTKWENLQGIVVNLSNDFLPIILKNALLTLLVLYGGVKAGLIYSGVIEAFQWYCPILPNLNWLIAGMIGIFIPVIAMSSIYEKHGVLTGELKVSKNQKRSIIGDAAMTVIVILAIWFVVGVFSYYPSAILTGSMEPGIMPGDVVIVHKIQSMEEIDQLKEGDIIQFKRDDLLINHRIIEVIQDKGQTLYRTKGDNNNAPDEKIVKAEDIKGTITEVVPKIGLLTVWLKEKALFKG